MAPSEETSKPRVLAVDDTPDALKRLRVALRNAGTECFTTQAAQAALEFLAREPVDLIITDVSMPEMDGYEFCRQVKLQERTRHIPVLFYSANVGVENRSRCLEVGGFDYISKPIDEQEFAVRLSAALMVARLERAVVEARAEPDQLRAEIQVLKERIIGAQPGILASHWLSHFGRLAADFLREVEPPLIAALAGVRRLSVQEKMPEEVRTRLRMVDVDFRRVDERLRRLMLLGAPSRVPRTLHLAEFVEDMLHLMAPQLHKFCVAVTTELDPTCEWRGMPGELGKAFIYILDNALEASEEKEKAHILIRVERNEERQFIRIADNGPGVPEEVRPRIFDSFFTTKGPPHTGSGLYLANAIVRAANGTIDVESPSGEWGAQFSINLPVSQPKGPSLTTGTMFLTAQVEAAKGGTPTKTE